MQDASPELQAAIDSYEQVPAASLEVSWDGTGEYDGDYDDLSDHFSTVRITRSLEGGLPAQARVISGSSVAELSTELVRGGTYEENQTASWWYSPYNTQSPLYGVEQLSRPARFSLGYYTSGGPQTIQQFLGTTTDVNLNRSPSMELVCQDQRRQVANPIQLPLIRNRGFHRPNNQFWVDYILRDNQIYSSPPQRPLSNAFVTMHGAIPAGTITSSTTQDQAIFTPGKFGYAWYNPSHEYGVDLTGTLPTTNNSSYCYSQAWVKFSSTDTGRLYRVWSLFSAQIIVSVQSGAIQVGWKRSAAQAASSVTTSPIAAGPADWHYVAFHVAFSSTQVTVNINIDGVTNTYTAATATITGQNPLTYLEVASDFPIQDIQVTRETWPAPSDHNFDPDAYIGNSINYFVCTPDPGTQDPWTMIKDIAEAECAVVMFDETGKFHFITQQQLLESTTSSAEISINTNIEQIGYRNGLQQVYNYINVVAAPLVEGDTQFIWKAGQPYQIGGGDDTLILHVHLPNPSDVDEGSPFQDGTTIIGDEVGNFIWANARRDGTGTNKFSSLEVSITNVTAQDFIITIINHALASSWLVTPQGEPGIYVAGIAYTKENSVNLTQAQDPTSQTTYGVRYLEIGSNPWRQDTDAAQLLADNLLEDLKTARPVLTNLTLTKADPRLQLTDRVDVGGPDGLSGQYWIQSITTEISAGGLKQSLSLRQAT